MTKKSKTASLQWQLIKSDAQDVATIANAVGKIKNLGSAKYQASGIILEIKNLSGETIIGPVVIHDGFSAETIASIKKDLEKTLQSRIDTATMFARG